MAYLDSTHFSDPKTYKTLFIPTYGLKDMTFAKLAYLQQFFRKTEKRVGSFSHRKDLSPGR
jgi:hypothetical protein